ncbi:MAG: hypothetical protein L0Z62_17125 [Gemmataceae bacterium]|nr:hypothetical protein [Gemmataceae bacterium]
MTPKPLSDSVHKGLAYLIGQQHPSGGWAQGGGWRSAAQGGRVEGPNVEDPPDVANTCVATLALLRAGHTPRTGDYAPNVARALDFVIGSIERADSESPYVTDLRDTQVQCKIGPYVDTFVSALVLGEARGQMADEKGEGRLGAALDKVVAKMEKHQQADGSWAMGGGWAPVVGQALGSAGLNRAYQSGAKVSEEALDRSEQYARSHYDSSSKTYSGANSAGVPLYGTASHLSSSGKTVANYRAAKAKLRKMAGSAEASKEEQQQAAERLKYIEEVEGLHEETLAATTAYLKDTEFVSGFGSNGGEEFLSYLNISETLAAKGGQEWEDWDKRMTQNLEHIQNADGCWAGHHCITGRTFCTATALLVLMADRAPRPDAVVVK